MPKQLVTHSRAVDSNKATRAKATRAQPTDGVSLTGSIHQSAKHPLRAVYLELKRDHPNLRDEVALSLFRKALNEVGGKHLRHTGINHEIIIYDVDFNTCPIVHHAINN